MEIKITDKLNDDLLFLVQSLDNELNARYGELQKEYNQYNKIVNIDVAVVSYQDNRPAGCGCYKEFDNECIEIKRMFVLQESRGLGIASKIIQELEKIAKDKGYKKAVLETGIKQFEAIHLYSKLGYVKIPNYGQYIGNTNSICMCKVF